MLKTLGWIALGWLLHDCWLVVKGYRVMRRRGYTFKEFVALLDQTKP